MLEFQERAVGGPDLRGKVSHRTDEAPPQVDANVQRGVDRLRTAANLTVVAASAEWHEVLRKASLVASTDTTVLVTGESGTGKEVVARFIHAASARKTWTVRGAELRRLARAASRVGAVWLRARRVHERAAVQTGPGGAGVGRRAVPRRGQRDESVGASQVPARAAGTRVPAARRHSRAEGQHSGHRRDQPRFAQGRRGGPVP